MEPKQIFMIAGPNGSCKTTIAFSTIPGMKKMEEFLNADEIARGLAPMHPESMAFSQLYSQNIIAKKEINKEVEIKNLDKWETIHRFADVS